MREMEHSRAAVIAGLATIGLGLAAVALTWVKDAQAEAEPGQSYQMPVAFISTGGGPIGNDSFAVVGQPVVGVAANEQYRMYVGAMPMLIAATTSARPGDFDGDGDTDLSDYGMFHDCLGGPHASFDAARQRIRERCLEVFDFDDDLDIDLPDVAAFERAFSGEEDPGLAYHDDRLALWRGQHLVELLQLILATNKQSLLTG